MLNLQHRRLKQLAFSVALVTVILSGIGCDSTTVRSEGVGHAEQVDPIETATAEEVARFCGDCHAVPSPSTFPKEAWDVEVERGFNFYFESFRTDLVPPAEEAVIAYYKSLAPSTLVATPPFNDVNPSNKKLYFEQQITVAPRLEPPGVATIQWLTLPDEGQKSLVFCDMRSGEINQVSVSTMDVETLATLKNPARLAICDLDGDGLEEIVVAELGSIRSGDHHRGALTWLRKDDAGKWEQRLLVDGLGRVADVRPADFDQDGDIDLVVAEFGHLQTGRILLYENIGVEASIPQLRERVLDDRHGCIHVPTGDINNDGHLDFVALISQEHELIEAYLGDGKGEFRRERLFTSDNPSYGSSGIQLVDLDDDEDLDVLYSNGDTFGSNYLKPYHGVTWLENRNIFPFKAHRLTDMVGVQRALATDMDGDNDLDIVAIGFMPSNLVSNAVVTKHDSIIWLEQIGGGKFNRHSLETGSFYHAALEAGDFDHDGDVDLAIGNFQDVDSGNLPWLTLWWNASHDTKAMMPAGNEPADE
jgi:FG-GAP-like repeat